MSLSTNGIELTFPLPQEELWWAALLPLLCALTDDDKVTRRSSTCQVSTGPLCLWESEQVVKCLLVVCWYNGSRAEDPWSWQYYHGYTTKKTAAAWGFQPSQQLWCLPNSCSPKPAGFRPRLPQEQALPFRLVPGLLCPDCWAVPDVLGHRTPWGRNCGWLLGHTLSRPVLWREGWQVPALAHKPAPHSYLFWEWGLLFCLSSGPTSPLDTHGWCAEFLRSWYWAHGFVLWPQGVEHWLCWRGRTAPRPPAKHSGCMEGRGRCAVDTILLEWPDRHSWEGPINEGTYWLDVPQLCSNGNSSVFWPGREQKLQPLSERSEVYGDRCLMVVFCCSSTEHWNLLGSAKVWAVPLPDLQVAPRASLNVCGGCGNVTN